MPSVLNTGVPAAPLIDAGGSITPVWRAFLLALYARTGGAIGMQTPDLAQLEAELDAERAARIAGDGALSGGLAAERTARTDADESLRRLVVFYAQTGQQTADNEAAIRAAADLVLRNTLVPLAGLAERIMLLDFSALPTADPGSGQLWRVDNHVVVGTSVSAVVGVGLEDATGRWRLEDGTGSWIWG